MVRRNNLEGDRQADLTVHGGPNKAVYGLCQRALSLLAKAISADGFALGSIWREPDYRRPIGRLAATLEIRCAWVRRC